MPIVNYQAEDPQGNSATYNDQEVQQHLAQAGYDVKGVSHDGLNVTLGNQWAKAKTDPPTVTLPIKSALEQTGLKINGIEPINSDQEAIDPWASAKLQKIEPKLHEAYIRNVLKDQYGKENPTVIGSGNKYHVFDPETGTYHQLTDEPGWNKTGALSALLAVPHTLGMGLGGALGGTLGTVAGSAPGAIVGATAGAGAGSMAGEGLTQEALRYLDDDYGKALDSSPSEEGYGILKTAGGDALAELGGGLLGRGLKAAVGNKAVAEAASNAMAIPGGFVSKLAKGAGSSIEGIGELARKGFGKIAGSDLGTDLAANFGPAGGVIGTAEAAMAPSVAIRGAAKAMAALPKIRNSLAEEALAGEAPNRSFISRLGRGVAGTAAGLLGDDTTNALGEYGEQLLAPNAPRSLLEKGTAFSERAGQALGADAPTRGTTRDVLHNFVNRLSNAGPAAEEFLADPASQSMLGEQAAADRIMSEEFGITGADQDKIVQEGRDALKKDAVNRILQQKAAEPNIGTSIGGALETLERGAGGVRAALLGATRLGARAGQGLGAAAQGTGYVMKNAANIASPLELPLELQYGLPRVANWWEDRHKK